MSLGCVKAQSYSIPPFLGLHVTVHCEEQHGIMESFGFLKTSETSESNH